MTLTPILLFLMEGIMLRLHGRPIDLQGILWLSVLLAVNSLKTVVPDICETYVLQLVLNLQNNGVPWVLYGTGGET